MALRSLDEFNQNRATFYGLEQAVTTRPNGIACPECGKELHDTSPNMTLTSNPPKKHVSCVSCGYRGYRIA